MCGIAGFIQHQLNEEEKKEVARRLEELAASEDFVYKTLAGIQMASNATSKEPMTGSGKTTADPQQPPEPDQKPTDTDPKESAEPTGEQNVVPRRKRLVWIVDDSPLDAEMTVKAIEGVFATRVFADGAQMLEQLDASPLPDVLILDWVMPRVSGIEVCRFLRTTAEARELSILMLTVQNKTQQVVEALGAGADDFLSKPYSREELVARVSSLMRATILREQAEGAGQQAAALALKKTERRYRALIEGLTDIVLVISGGRKRAQADAVDLAAGLAERRLRERGIGRCRDKMPRQRPRAAC